MGQLIVFALSNALSVLLTAWVLHRARIGLSPLPTPTSKVEVSNGENVEVHFEKGRPVL